MLLLALSLAIAQSPVVLDESFDKWGEAPPAGWLAGPGCAIAEGGYLGGKCLSVTGDGKGDGGWLTEVPLEPGKLYRVSFRGRGEYSGGSATSGPTLVNHDLGFGPSWERYSYVCRIPDDAKPPFGFRLGQWMAKGTLYFDEVVVSKVEAADCGPFGLGEGERLSGASYRFDAPVNSEAGNRARPLVRTTAPYNTNRWWIREGNEVVFRHEVPDARQLSATVSLSSEYYEAGALAVEVSADGVEWRELGRIEKASSGKWEAPEPPGAALWVRLRGLPGASLQVHAYSFEARLDRDRGPALGKTLFLDVRRESPELGVRIGGLSPTEVTLELLSQRNAQVGVTAGLAGGEVAERAVSLRAKEPSRVSLPLYADKVGLRELALSVLGPGGTLWSARAFVPVTVLSLADYGELLPPSGPLSLWWCDATRKVSRDRPLPTEPSADGEIRLEAAGGEFEPVQLVLTPSREVGGTVLVDVTDLTGPDGATIPSERIAVEKVEYVEVVTPTDATGCAGLWPDPLPPATEPFALETGRNQPVWIRVSVPRGAAAGDYTGDVWIHGPSGPITNVPLRLHVFGFDLPEKQSVTASFGLDPSVIQRYHNLESPDELEAVWSAYLENFAEHRVTPYDPMQLHPYRLSFPGREWDGGDVSAERPYEGTACGHVLDDRTDAAVQLSTAKQIPVERDGALELSWAARTSVEGQQYLITLNSYDEAGRWLSGRNVDVACTGSTAWREEALHFEPGRLAEAARFVTITFRPALWSEMGEMTGEMWIDNIAFGPAGGASRVPDPGFEAVATVPRAVIDWSDFDAAARHYLDDLGMPLFCLRLEGLGSGTFFSRTPGSLAGYTVGSAEYEEVMRDYLGQVESHLRDNGWLEKAYVYWFDEPDPKDYEFVREVNERIGRYAPGIKRMLTEQPESELLGAVDIWCALTPEFREEIAQPRMEAGDAFWWYVCTGPKAPWCTLFTDHPATDMRVWLWQTFERGITGTLIWTTNYWTSSAAYPSEPQNPWVDPMSYVSGYDSQPGQIRYWGNGDGRLVYPPNRDPSDRTTKYLGGPVNSLRWEMLREGMEDYEYLALLRARIAAAREAGISEADLAEAEALLTVPDEISASMTSYTIDSKPIYERRRQIAEAIELLTQ